MTSPVSDWVRPKNTYVEVGDRDLPVPEIDDAALQCILDCADITKGDRLGDMADALKWFKSLTDDEVEAATVYFNDRWTWDSGHHLDLFFLKIFELERARRRELTITLEPTILSKRYNRVMEMLDILAEREEDNGDTQE